MSNYTPPNAITVCLSYIDGRKNPFKGGIWTPDHEREYQRYKGEFERWLAEHDRQIAAEAWDEGYEDHRADEHEHRPGRKHTNPYKEQP